MSNETIYQHVSKLVGGSPHQYLLTMQREGRKIECLPAPMVKVLDFGAQVFVTLHSERMMCVVSVVLRGKSNAIHFTVQDGTASAAHGVRENGEIVVDDCQLNHMVWTLFRKIQDLGYLASDSLSTRGAWPSLG